MDVSLVIPGRNAEATLNACLDSVVPLLDRGELEEIIFVDDGSTDSTARLAGGYPVTVLTSRGEGVGAARNLGWKAATSPLIWFVDSDCVAADDALAVLHEHLRDESVDGCSGSYTNMRPESPIATLIHEEIVQRHLSMPRSVDFLAAFNVLYRRRALEQVGGFDERFRKGQDAELAIRVRKAGGRLELDIDSLVGHFHANRLGAYLRTQREQGYWRVWLYGKHPDASRGDSYSGWTDHLQPPVALLAAASLPLTALPAGWMAPALLVLVLALLQVPMTRAIVVRTRSARLLLFAPFSMTRALWRGIGLAHGVAATILRCLRPPLGDDPSVSKP